MIFMKFCKSPIPDSLCKNIRESTEILFYCSYLVLWIYILFYKLLEINKHSYYSISKTLIKIPMIFMEYKMATKII